jgi:hypothetical protein
MSYPDQSGGPYPPRDIRDPGESQYPPPPEEDDRARAYHQRAPSSNSVTLPSISPYDPQYAAPNGYAPDPRVYRPDPYRDTQQGYGRDDRGGYPVDYRAAAPQHMAFSQSAPRQRTAIACRYCRRRKVRNIHLCISRSLGAKRRFFVFAVYYVICLADSKDVLKRCVILEIPRSSAR